MTEHQISIGLVAVAALAFAAALIGEGKEGRIPILLRVTMALLGFGMLYLAWMISFD